MSRIVDLQRRLQDTNTAISRAERAVVLHPEFISAAVNLRSFVKMRERLEFQFLVEADRLELDACSYCVMPEGSRPTLSGLAAVLGDFQRLFTTVYDSVVNGPKRVAKAADGIIDATSLGFAYTFPGSVGFMLTLENKRFLIGSTELDAAMNGVFDLMNIKSTDEASSASQRWGVAALRVAHQWARANSDAKFGADIAWLRKERITARLQLQRPEVARLEKAIRQTTEVSESEMRGEISMVDWDSKTFRMKSEGVEFVGTFDDSAIGQLQPATVPGFYRATVRTSRNIIADGDSSPSYLLIHLSPLAD